MKKQSDVRMPDKKKLLREANHLTRPPRLEGAVKEAMMQPIRKERRRRQSADS